MIAFSMCLSNAHDHIVMKDLMISTIARGNVNIAGVVSKVHCLSF